MRVLKYVKAYFNLKMQMRSYSNAMFSFSSHTNAAAITDDTVMYQYMHIYTHTNLYKKKKKNQQKAFIYSSSHEE